MLKVQENYAIAKAKHETVLKFKKECQKRVLKENEFYTTEGERTNLLNDYMMTDSDSIKYWKLCFTEYQKAGLKPTHYENAVDHPFWVALRKAENDLIEWGKSKIEKLPASKLHAKDIEKLYEEIKHNFKIRDKVINLTMRLKVDI